VVCPSVAVCVVVGSYVDSSPAYRGFLLTGSGKSWSAVEAPLPANAEASPDVVMSSVACPSAAVCVAAGTYFPDSSRQRGLLLTGSGKSWSAVEAPLPANASGWGAYISSVACSSVAACVAAGNYPLTQVSSQGLLLTGSGKTWSAVEAPLPANAAGPDDNEVEISSVACPSAAACVAAGTYNMGTAQFRQGLLLTGSGTSWSAVEAPLPANAEAGDPEAGDGAPSAVACPSAAVCVAAGTYVSDLADDQQGLLLAGTGKSWSAVQAPLPANGSEPDRYDPAGVSAVACPSVAVCVAVGSYGDSSGDLQGLLITRPA
jgi:hypothetical protein